MKSLGGYNGWRSTVLIIRCIRSTAIWSFASSKWNWYILVPNRTVPPLSLRYSKQISSRGVSLSLERPICKSIFLILFSKSLYRNWWILFLKAKTSSKEFGFSNALVLIRLFCCKNFIISQETIAYILNIAWQGHTEKNNWKWAAKPYTMHRLTGHRRCFCMRTAFSLCADMGQPCGVA